MLVAVSLILHLKTIIITTITEPMEGKAGSDNGWMDSFLHSSPFHTYFQKSISFCIVLASLDQVLLHYAKRKTFNVSIWLFVYLFLIVAFTSP